MAEKSKKTLDLATAKAVAAVLEKQGERKQWDAAAHTAGLAFLASDLPLGADGKFDRKGFMKVLGAEPAWLYQSNMKKVLAEVGEIPAQDAKTELDLYS